MAMMMMMNLKKVTLYNSHKVQCCHLTKIGSEDRLEPALQLPHVRHTSRNGQRNHKYTPAEQTLEP